jgi:AhpD family alkylhydroperoxidase
MTARLDYRKFAKEPIKALLDMETYVAQCGLDHKLLHMIKLRASQINGCAYCIDMHWKDARAAGESDQRLYGLDAWRESPYYNDRERAALEWTESLTLIAATHAPDEAFAVVKTQFSDKEIVDLTYAISTINAWNRIAISMRAVPGHYQPAQKSSAAT